MLRKKLKGTQLNKGSSAAYVLLVAAVVLAATLPFTKGLLPRMNYSNEVPAQTQTQAQIAANTDNAVTCCDSGNGADCHPLAEKSITFNGEQYGLLKSNITETEVEHLEITDPAQYANPATGEGRIFINASDKMDLAAKYADQTKCQQGQDFIQDGTSGQCFGIPNDAMIYVCKATKAECDKNANTGQIPFDVYYRMSDYAASGIPSTISQCVQLTGNEYPTQKIIGLPTPKGDSNLQLETFQVKEEPFPAQWLTSWCKPAINLYPTEKTRVHVVVSPKAPFIYTIPTYPKGGWDVTAYPDGKIVHEGKNYPYLYWEASLPDSLLTQPKEGYVIAYKDLPDFFSNTLPKIGLNTKEINEFSTYWLKALPDSPYYFIGFMPEEQINYLAPLTVQPAPDSVLRVSLYFKELDKKIDVAAPQLAEFKRVGFTVTEWGGFFKGNKKHANFTCWM